MSYLRAVPFDESEYPPFQAMKQQFGFLPNLFRAQTMRPDLIEAEAELVGALLIRDGALTRRQKEYIFLVSSAANRSTYCVTAHCEIVRALGFEGPEPESIAIDHAHADIPAGDKALLDFARKLNDQPTKVGPGDIEGLRTCGFNEQQIMETVLVVGLAKFANFVSFGLGTVPDFDPVKLTRTAK